MVPRRELDCWAGGCRKRSSAAMAGDGGGRREYRWPRVVGKGHTAHVSSAMFRAGLDVEAERRRCGLETTLFGRFYSNSGRFAGRVDKLGAVGTVTAEWKLGLVKGWMDGYGGRVRRKTFHQHLERAGGLWGGGLGGSLGAVGQGICLLLLLSDPGLPARLRPAVGRWGSLLSTYIFARAKKQVSG